LLCCRPKAPPGRPVAKPPPKGAFALPALSVEERPKEVKENPKPPANGVREGSLTLSLQLEGGPPFSSLLALPFSFFPSHSSLLTFSHFPSHTFILEWKRNCYANLSSGQLDIQKSKSKRKYNK